MVACPCTENINTNNYVPSMLSRVDWSDKVLYIFNMVPMFIKAILEGVK